MADAEKLYSNLPKNKPALVGLGYMLLFSLVLVVLLLAGVLPRENDPSAMRVLMWAIPAMSLLMAFGLCFIPYGYSFDGKTVAIKALAKKQFVSLSECDKVALSERIANVKGESVERIVLVCGEKTYVVVGFAPDFAELRDQIVAAVDSSKVFDVRTKEEPKDAGKD